MWLCNVQVLEYHVVPGVSALAANLSDGEMLQTALPNQTIKVSFSPLLCSLKSER